MLGAPSPHPTPPPRRSRARKSVVCALWLWCCAPLVAQAQEERPEAQAAQAAMPMLGEPSLMKLSLSSHTQRELTAPSLTAPCKIGLELEDQLKRFARMTHEGVTELLQLRQLYHQKTAALPLLPEDMLLVSHEYISWNLLGGMVGGLLTPAPIPVVFGPYIQNWQSARRAYEGHYGVRLQLPW
jgi:hypothetical protein